MKNASPQGGAFFVMVAQRKMIEGTGVVFYVRSNLEDKSLTFDCHTMEGSKPPVGSGTGML